ncbi:phage tail tape measure protein [Pseudomonas farsensis]|uniref:Phage tail tape measure protein n=1 Tax=Pseudomonas farsensis TaxID=2745492 RepID=A0ABU8QN50_9PSED
MASRSLGTLTLDLIARIGGFQQGMDQASRSLARTGSAADAASARVSAMQGSFLSLSGAASTLSTALASAFSLHALYAASEAYTTLTSRMLLVTEGSAQLAAAQKAVFGIAQSSYQPLAATAELYQRIATNQKELKLSGEGVAGIVGTISKTMAISGASAASANAALIQLGQAFASGVLRGEELNSVMEQAPALAQAIAAGMGKTVGELRTLGQAGLLTADAVVKALQSQQQAVDELFAKTAVSIGNSLTALENSFTQVVGRLDQASGVSASISSSIVSASKALDGFTSNATTTAKTIQSFSSAAETLAYVFGARLALSGAQAASSFALATKASIQQAAALVATTAAQWGAVNADSAASRQALETAKSRQADALALMERARLEVVTAEQKIAADRMRQASEINNLKSVQATLAAERSLEGQRLKAQINEQGRALAIARMAAARLDEVAIIRQIQAAEAQLAATTAATSAEMQAAYAVRTAAVTAYGETTLAVNAAVRTSDAATAAASNASKAILLTAAAGRGLLALLTGPVGLIFATGLVAASFFSMRTSADEATQALSAHGATVDEVREKYEKLSGAQQRVKRLEWIDEQQEALSIASSALEDYAFKIERGIDLGPQTKQFRKMIEEVERGQRTLDSVTTWIESQASLYPEFRKEIAGLTRDYDNNVQKADELKAVLGGLDGETKKVSQSSEQMRAVLNASQEQTKTQVAKWEDYIGKLRETRDLFGANKKAQAEFEASKMGLNDKQREEARLVASQIDVMDKYKDAVKDGDKAKQQSLRKELEAIYARQQALAEAAAAEKKLQDAANKAAEESANKKINEMRRVLEAANQVFNAAAGFSAKSSFLTGRNMLLATPEQQSIVGRSMVAPGAPTPAAGVVPRKTPQQLAAERLAQIDETTDPKKTSGDKSEKALVKRFETMEEGYKRQIELINTSTDKRKNATEVEKLAFEISSGKLEGVNAQQRKRLEGLASELDALKKLKQAEEDAKKLESFRSSVNESYLTAKNGFDQEMAGAGRGDKYKERLKERLAIEEDFNRQQRELVLQRNSGDVSQALYDKETQLLSDALAARLALQEEHYAEVDEARADWMDGVSDAWQNFADAATNYSAMAADATTSVLGSARSELSTFMSDVATGSKDAGDALMDMVSGFAKSMINALTDMAAQWLIYQAVQLLVGKSTASIAGMGMVANAQAMSFQAQLSAYASTAAIPLIGPAMAPAAAMTAAMATAPMVAGVASTALMGIAHNGLDNIPREGTWLLDGGERVLNPNQNRDLTQYLRSANDGGAVGGGGGGITINAPITVQGQPGMSDEDSRRQGEAMGEGLKQTIRKVLNEEFGQGGTMGRRR